MKGFDAAAVGLNKRFTREKPAQRENHPEYGENASQKRRKVRGAHAGGGSETVLLDGDNGKHACDGKQNAGPKIFDVRKKDGNCTKSGSPAKGCRKTAFFVLTPDALIHAGAGDLHDLSVLREFTLDEFREVGA